MRTMTTALMMATMTMTLDYDDGVDYGDDGHVDDDYDGDVYDDDN